MKKVWIPVSMVCGLGLLSVLAYGIYSIAKNVSYDVLGYSVQSLDNEGVTFRVSFLISNPSGINLEIWNQKYSVYVGSYLISQATSQNHYSLLANNSSVIPLDIHLNWQDIQTKVLPLYSQSSLIAIGDLPVLIKGNLSAKTGFFKVTGFPVRFTGRLAWFLP